jgi:hypothetical protein
MFLRYLLLIPTCAALAWGLDRAPVEPKSLPAPDQEVAPVTPSVQKLDDSRYQIGEVTLDKETREIRFPAQVNMAEGLIEYLIVTQKGKLHESLLVTEISPTNLNLAFKLLRYQPSPELYPLPNETGGVSGQFPEVPADVKAAARVRIDVEWSENGKVRRIPVNEWVQHEVKAAAMPAGPWVYGGSVFENGKYSPELTGDIVVISIMGYCMISYPGEDHDNDSVWIPYPKRVPAAGTKVTVIIAPYQTAKPLPKP